MGARKLVVGGAAIGTALGTRWVLGRRPASRIPSREDISDPRAVQAYVWVSGLPHFRALYRWLARRALWGVAGAGRALDMGCGPGGLVREMARRAPGLELVGLDRSQEMLDIAAVRAAGFGPRVSWRQGSVDQLPFPNESFHLVVSTLSLHHWRDPVPVFDEMARVLKPGGRLMVFDFRRDVAELAWLGLWLAQHVLVPSTLRAAGEPLGSVEAAYTPRELVELAHQSTLPPWRVASGPLWLSLENANTP